MTQQQFQFGTRLGLPSVLSHRVARGEPATRPLRIFTMDPSLSRLDGSIAVADVPYEPHCETTGVDVLVGRLFSVDVQPGPDTVSPLQMPTSKGSGSPFSLDIPTCLLQQGYAPSEADPRFHAQMVYAVANSVHASFRRALGRQIGWNLPDARPLRLRPFYTNQPNAWYEPLIGEIRFGFLEHEREGWIFTSLSHDIIAHEVAHAVLDGLRGHFADPTSRDVLGFHEGFADLVALFHHYQYRGALRAALERTGGRLMPAKGQEDVPGYGYLTGIASQFGRIEGQAALRRATTSRTYAADADEHALGEVLVAAVFDAFATVHERKTKALRRLAGAIDAGTPLYPDLLDLLVDAASKLARQFLDMVIRAIDYCPPVDLQLGEYLQALITADADLVPDDPFGYREALIDAFRSRGIRPRGVLSLSEDSLRWKPPRQVIVVPELAYAEVRFDGDPDCPLPGDEQRRLAKAVLRCITQAAHLRECGLVSQDDPAMSGIEVWPPVIESVRTLRRPSPDGRVLFETVVEVTQGCLVPREGDAPAFSFEGGATLIFSSDGALRLAISKCINGAGRVQRRREYLSTSHARRFWRENDHRLQARPDWCLNLHTPPKAP